MRINDRKRPSQTVKADPPLLVPCKLANCLYYEGAVPRDPTKCFCSHPQKPSYMTESGCPLFYLDWQKNLKKLPGQN